MLCLDKDEMNQTLGKTIFRKNNKINQTNKPNKQMNQILWCIFFHPKVSFTLIQQTNKPRTSSQFIIDDVIEVKKLNIEMDSKSEMMLAESKGSGLADMMQVKGSGSQRQSSSC